MQLAKIGMRLVNIEEPLVMEKKMMMEKIVDKEFLVDEFRMVQVVVG